MTEQKKKFTLNELIPLPTEMPVVHPTLGDLDFTIRLQGMWVPTVKQKSLEAVSWLQKVNKDTNADELVNTINKVESISAESAAAAIIGWSDDEIMGGGYSPQYALELMKRPEMSWLKDQVNAFAQNQKNFFRKPNTETDQLG